MVKSDRTEIVLDSASSGPNPILGREPRNKRPMIFSQGHVMALNGGIDPQYRYRSEFYTHRLSNLLGGALSEILT